MPISSRTVEWRPSAPMSRSNGPDRLAVDGRARLSAPCSREPGDLRVEAKGHTLRDGGRVEDAGQIRPIHPQRSRIVGASGLRFGQGHDDRSAGTRRPDDKTLGRIPLLEHLVPDAELVQGSQGVALQRDTRTQRSQFRLLLEDMHIDAELGQLYRCRHCGDATAGDRHLLHRSHCGLPSLRSSSISR